LFSVVLGLCLIMTVLPFVMVLLATFMKLFGFFAIPAPWTLNHWKAVFADPQFAHAFMNTILVGVGAVAASVVVFPPLAYLIARTQHPGRQALDFLSWLPSAIPGIVIGLGFLWLFLELPIFKPFYGTRFALVIACTLGCMTIGVQIIKSSFAQFGNELQEASQAHGAGWWYTFLHISLPLSAPALVGVAVWSFGAAAREVSLVALLSTRSIEPLSIYQLLFIGEGRLEQAAVIGVIIMLLSVGVMAVAQLFGVSYSSAQRPVRN
jgi:iron(III) transport system permease protein